MLFGKTSKSLFLLGKEALGRVRRLEKEAKEEEAEYLKKQHQQQALKSKKNWVPRLIIAPKVVSCLTLLVSSPLTSLLCRVVSAGGGGER